jgi:7-cyano-7-deazaguanine synthase
MGGSIVLVSGGLDSAVTAAVAVKEGGCSFLHVKYGQRTEARELEAFRAISEFFKVERTLIADIGYLKDIGGSALTDTSIEVPERTEGDAGTEGIPVTYVPFRNAHLLAIAVSWAEVTGADKIYIGAVEEDRPGYPDCRREFFDAFERAATLGTRAGTEGGRGIKIITPLIKMNKGEIVRLGAELNAPFHLTWSCYKNEAVACGLCDSCLLRLAGFMDAGIVDPIPYKDK